MSASQAADPVDSPKPAGWTSFVQANSWRNLQRWRKALVAVGAIAIAAYVGGRVVAYVSEDANRPAAEKIVTALEAFRAANGTAPEKLGELQPKFFAKLPRPVPDTHFVYSRTPDGKTFFFGYQTTRENLAEYDSRARKWEYVDYEDSFVLRQRNKEFVKP
jgi:hypothetical protein